MKTLLILNIVTNLVVLGWHAYMFTGAMRMRRRHEQAARNAVEVFEGAFEDLPPEIQKHIKKMEEARKAKVPQA